VEVSRCRWRSPVVALPEQTRRMPAPIWAFQGFRFWCLRGERAQQMRQRPAPIWGQRRLVQCLPCPFPSPRAERGRLMRQRPARPWRFRAFRFWCQGGNWRNGCRNGPHQPWSGAAACGAVPAGARGPGGHSRDRCRNSPHQFGRSQHPGARGPGRDRGNHGGECSHGLGRSRDRRCAEHPGSHLPGGQRGHDPGRGEDGPGHPQCFAGAGGGRGHGRNGCGNGSQQPWSRCRQRSPFISFGPQSGRDWRGNGGGGSHGLERSRDRGCAQHSCAREPRGNWCNRCGNGPHESGHCRWRACHPCGCGRGGHGRNDGSGGAVQSGRSRDRRCAIPAGGGGPGRNGGQ
jgi:hypothetical protein